MNLVQEQLNWFLKIVRLGCGNYGTSWKSDRVCAQGVVEIIKNQIVYYTDSDYGARTYVEQKSKEKFQIPNFLLGAMLCNLKT